MILNLTSCCQRELFKNYVDSFEKVLYSQQFKDTGTGYRAYLDVNSFVDYFIIGEVSRNVDAYKKSRFYFKDRDSKNGLIHSGPPWDFDWAWKDITEDCINFNQTDGSGWAYRVNDCFDWPIPPSWEVKLMQDDLFANKIHNRYYQLRNSILSKEYLDHVIDSVALLLDEAQKRHYEKWKILGINVGTPEYGEQPLTFSGEIEKFKSWISRRLVWLDANMVGEATSVEEEPQAVFRIFPNPAAGILHIESDTEIKRIEIIPLAGNKLQETDDTHDYSVSVDVSPLDPGLYIVRIHLISGDVVSHRFVKK
jgi:hypothetical protein